MIQNKIGKLKSKTINDIFVQDDGKCYICENHYDSIFSITPLLQTPDGIGHFCCENCANIKFPGWDQED